MDNNKNSLNFFIRNSLVYLPIILFDQLLSHILVAFLPPSSSSSLQFWTQPTYFWLTWVHREAIFHWWPSEVYEHTHMSKVFFFTRDMKDLKSRTSFFFAFGTHHPFTCCFGTNCGHYTQSWDSSAESDINHLGISRRILQKGQITSIILNRKECNDKEGAYPASCPQKPIACFVYNQTGKSINQITLLYCSSLESQDSDCLTRALAQ